MKFYITLSVLVTIINCANLLSNNDILLTDSIKTESISLNEKEISADTSLAPTALQKRLLQSEFMYADNPQYTITGELPLRETELNPLRASIIGAIYTGAFIAQHEIQLNTIWKETAPFKIMEDGHYALYVDKAGHFFGTWVMSHFLRETYLFSGFDYKSSYWLGALTGLLYSSYVEVLDGFGANWGFSPSDFYLDVLGTSFSIAQYYYPVLQNFTPKFQYVPSPWFGERKRVPSEIMIDDYSSQVFWMSINVHNLLSDELKAYWPSWLQLSIGYTARNLCDRGYPEYNQYEYDVELDDVKGDPRLILALDYDMIKLLPGDNKFWNWIKQSMNVLKFPSPAVEFSKRGTRFYLLFPFKL